MLHEPMKSNRAEAVNVGTLTRLGEAASGDPVKVDDWVEMSHSGSWFSSPPEPPV